MDQYRLRWKSGVVFAGVNGSPSFGLPPMPGGHFFFPQAAERRHPKKRFNNKQTRGRGYLNHAEKNPSGLDWLTNERHVMLILHFTLQTITQTPGALSAP